MIHRLQTINRASSDLQGFFPPPPRWANACHRRRLTALSATAQCEPRRRRYSLLVHLQHQRFTSPLRRRVGQCVPPPSPHCALALPLPPPSVNHAAATPTSCTPSPCLRSPRPLHLDTPLATAPMTFIFIFFPHPPHLEFEFQLSVSTLRLAGVP